MSRFTGRLLAVIAVGAWGATAVLAVLDAAPALTLCATLAGTSTVTAVLGRLVAPVSAVWRHGYTEGRRVSR